NAGRSQISVYIVCFFFQAEDGIRDSSVTGVQTCALPISAESRSRLSHRRRRGRCRRRRRCERRDLLSAADPQLRRRSDNGGWHEIGRASCREGWWSGGGVGGVRRQLWSTDRARAV